MPRGEVGSTDYTEGNLAGTQAGEGDVVLSRISSSGLVDFSRSASAERVTMMARGPGALVGKQHGLCGGFTESKTFDGANVLGAMDGLAMRYNT
jgi:hypothetical protein